MKKILLLFFVVLHAHGTWANFELEVFKSDVQRIENGKAYSVEGRRFLKDRESFKLSEKGVARLTDSQGVQGFFYGPGEFTYTQIKGQNPIVQLKEGTFRWEAKGAQKFSISTGISETQANEGSYIISYNPRLPKVDWWVLRGALLVRGWGQDEFHAIKAGERSSFLGENEAGQPVFDILLRGARVVRGKLMTVEKFAPQEISEFEKLRPWLKRADPPKKKPVTRLAEQICEKPYARLNECIWRMEKNACIRDRCLANGEWGDSVAVPNVPECSSKPTPKPCGY